MSLFELELVGGPWGRRLARRRAGFDRLPWETAGDGVDAASLEVARACWTQSAFSEYASAAAFAQIASALLAAHAPIDLVAAAGDFVVDEVIHAELSGRVAMALGGAVPLDVDFTRLARPADADDPLLRAAELVVRTSCVGEALTVPILKLARAQTKSTLIDQVLGRIVQDESRHAQLGPWFLDWATDRLSTGDRAYLAAIAGAALRSFAPIFAGDCSPGVGLGTLGCDAYGETFDDAVRRRVAQPLRARGIVISREDLEHRRRREER